MDPSCFIHGNIFESFFSSKWTINKISKETRIVLNFIIKHRINRTIRRIIFPNIFYSKNTRVHWKCTHEFSFSGERTSSLVPEYFPFYTNKCKVWRRVSFERKKEKKKYWKNKRRKESFQVTFFAPEIFPFLLRVSWRTWRTISPRRREDKEKRVSTRVIIVRARAFARKRTRYSDICILQHIRGRNTIQLGARPRISWLDPVGIILALRVDRIIAC